MIYPGTFDPITCGHVDLIGRACRLFDEVIVGVAHSKEKGPMYSFEQRLAMVDAAIKRFPNAKAVGFGGLLVDFAKEQQARIIIRGLRAVSDFEYELQIAYSNRSLDETIETICLMPSLEHAFISSTVVRSILRHGGSVAHLVPVEIHGMLG